MNAHDKALLRRYHEQNDLAAREQLIEQYMSLVRSLARRYSDRADLDEILELLATIGVPACSSRISSRSARSA